MQRYVTIWECLKHIKMFDLDRVESQPFSDSEIIEGSFYIAQYSVRWTAQSALHF